MGHLNIVSKKRDRFLNRQEAGEALASVLAEYAGRQTVALGIPRGGIVVASSLAAGIGCYFNVLMAHKIGAPGNEELAVGAISEQGRLFDEEALPLGFDYLDREVKRQAAVLNVRAKAYRRILPKVSLQSKNVILTDDGAATGFTMKAALRAAREENPGRLIAALPVAPEDTLRRITGLADETVCLWAPGYFASVGSFFCDFDSVKDEDLTKTLKAGASANQQLERAV